MIVLMKAFCQTKLNSKPKPTALSRFTSKTKDKSLIVIAIFGLNFSDLYIQSAAVDIKEKKEC